MNTEILIRPGDDILSGEIKPNGVINLRFQHANGLKAFVERNRFHPSDVIIGADHEGAGTVQFLHEAKAEESKRKPQSRKKITVHPDAHESGEFTVAVQPNESQIFHTPTLSREELIAMRDAITEALTEIGYTCPKCGAWFGWTRHWQHHQKTCTAKVEPKPERPYIPPFNENDCGGVFDGNGVISDADPGL